MTAGSSPVGRDMTGQDRRPQMAVPTGSGAITVVAGNGPSLARIAPGAVLAQDRIVRTNNFFFEPCFYLGNRVDLALIAGDPRVAPFALRTLADVGDQYHITAWGSPDPRVRRAGRRIRALPPAQELSDLAQACPGLARVLQDQMTRYQARPTTGIRALIESYAQGARHIVLAGLDLYAPHPEGPARYAYDPGPHQRALLGADLGHRGYDRHLHHPDLDRALIAWLVEQEECRMWQAGDAPALTGLVDAAPLRNGPPPNAPEKRPVLDWTARSGWYPIAALKLLRRARARTMRFTKDPTL